MIRPVGGDGSDIGAYEAQTDLVPPVVSIVGGPLTFPGTQIGNNSAEQTFTVSGTDLFADIVVTAPDANFQVSLTSGSGFGPLLFVIIMGLVAWLIFNSPSENTQEGPKVNQVEYPDNTRENRAPTKRFNQAPNKAPAQEPRQYANPVLQ